MSLVFYIRRCIITVRYINHSVSVTKEAIKLPDNNNAGMHFIRFPSERSALHEFDYDNQVGSNIGKKKENLNKQTSMWTTDGRPIDLQASIQQHQKKKMKFAKKQAEEMKKQEMQKNSKVSNTGIPLSGSTTNNSKVRSVREEKPTIKTSKKETQEIKKSQGTKNTRGNSAKNLKQSVPKKKTDTISPNALGNDPRFKALFASLKD